ncbi:Retrovirus-related Pol polyprotein from transposon TNT 1-94 [Nymphaea thermarum]|nr:Retrovirus-related Pol polyprotein from transposon TNT 1-94 [Nymphaea thermarum]
MPTRVLNGHSPYSVLWPTQNPWPLTPRVFGCVCFVHDHSPTLKKLDPRSIKAVFLGYSSTQKGYKCVDPSTSRVYVSRDVTFHELEAYFPANPLQGECLGERVEEYSQHQLIEFTDFLEYTASSPSVVDTVSESRDSQMERDTVSEGRDSQMEGAPVEEQPCGHLFGQVYNRKQKDVLDVVEATNPNLVSSPDDPSPMSDDLPIAMRKGTRSWVRNRGLICPALDVCN